MTMVMDLITVLIFGLIGGFVHNVLYTKSFDLPHTDPGTKKFMWGSLDDIIAGIVAAIITYLETTVGTTAASVSGTQLILIALTAGIGGSAVISAYQKNTTLQAVKPAGE
jgi:uncharacterized membrane protein YeaQ/YmgE (transglycosylase-associated protein family)